MIKNLLSLSSTGLAMAAITAIFAYASIHPSSALSNKNGLSEYAVVFQPTLSKNEVFERIVNAGGYPIRETAFDFMMIAAFEKKTRISSKQIQDAFFVFTPFIKGACTIQDRSRFSKSQERV